MHPKSMNNHNINRFISTFLFYIVFFKKQKLEKTAFCYLIKKLFNLSSHYQSSDEAKNS